MKNKTSIIIVVWGIAVLCTLFLSSCKRPEVLDNSTLVNSARNVALTFGPAYVPFFKEANVSDVQVFKRMITETAFLKSKNNLEESTILLPLHMIVLPLNLISDLQQESVYGKIQENHWM